jgi:carbamoyltransferase
LRPEAGTVIFEAFDPGRAAHRAQAEALHDRLVTIGFGPQRAAALFGVAEMTEIKPARVAFYDAYVLAADAADRAARFFVLHLPESDADLRAWLGDDLVTFLAEMEAIVPVARGWRSPVSVTWMGGRMILADARAYNAFHAGEPPADYVMPPGGDSLGLVRVAPRERRRRALDVCCGSGVQALFAANYSDEVVGVDVNPRALRFARVNAAANRVERATFVEGDTYAPLGGERFDAIVANPPFVPWPPFDTGLLYRGGGARGEDVIERILAGAVAHLERSGSLAIVADFVDVDGLAARMQRWQGEARRTLLVLERHHALLDYAERHAAHLDGDAQKAAVLRQLRHYEASGIRTLDFGYLVQGDEPGHLHVMRTASARTNAIAADVSAWFAHQRRFAQGAIDETELVLAPGLRLVRTAFRTDDGQVAETYAVEPAFDSMLEAVPVSALAFGLLERIAARALRPRDMDDIAEVRELASLLHGGWVRIRG